MGIQVRGSPRWLHRPLCCKYVIGAFKAVHVPQGNRPDGSRWHWALGMRAGELEVLGAWSSCSGDLKQIADDLTERGVERIQLVCIDDTVDQATLALGMARVDCGFASSSLQVDDFASAMNIATQFAGGKRRALLSAVAVAERLHGGLVRALNRVAPFNDEEAAGMFVAQWLERADRSLGDLASPLRRMAAPARVPMLPGATRSAAH